MTPSMKSCIDHNSNILNILIEETIKVKKLQQCRNHLCYKTDFLFAKSRGPQNYFKYTILNSQ